MDSKTIIILIAVSSFINCLLIIPYHRRQYSEPIRYHLYAQGCFFAAFFLFAIDGALLRIAVANCGILFGAALEVLAIMKLKEQYSERKKKMMVAMVGVTAVIQATLLLVVDLSSIRIALVTAVTGILWLYAAYLLIAGDKRSTLQLMIGMLFIIIVGASGLRVYEALTYDGVYLIYTKGTAQTLTFVSMFAFMIVSGSGIILLAKESADEQLHRTVIYDELTEIFSRRHFIREAEKAIDFASRQKTSFSLLMFDIDHFKNINDNFGHQCGDSVLKEFAAELKNGLRQYDLVGRVGGEEFLILLQAIHKEDAYTTAERIRSHVEQNKICGVSFTTSVGIYSVDPNEGKDNDFDEIYRKSDLALYEAKKNGRNQVIQKTNREPIVSG